MGIKAKVPPIDSVEISPLLEPLLDKEISKSTEKYHSSGSKILSADNELIRNKKRLIGFSKLPKDSYIKKRMVGLYETFEDGIKGYKKYIAAAYNARKEANNTIINLNRLLNDKKAEEGLTPSMKIARRQVIKKHIELIYSALTDEKSPLHNQRIGEVKQEYLTWTREYKKVKSDVKKNFYISVGVVLASTALSCVGGWGMTAAGRAIFGRTTGGAIVKQGAIKVGARFSTYATEAMSLTGQGFGASLGKRMALTGFHMAGFNVGPMEKVWGRKGILTDAFTATALLGMEKVGVGLGLKALARGAASTKYLRFARVAKFGQKKLNRFKKFYWPQSKAKQYGKKVVKAGAAPLILPS